MRLSVYFKLLYLILMAVPNLVIAQGVRSFCPSGDCAGGGISPYFYLYLFLFLAAYALYNILKGTPEEKRGGYLFFKMLLKIVILIVCSILIGVIIGYLFTSTGAGMATVFGCFFYVLLSDRFNWFWGKDWDEQ